MVGPVEWHDTYEMLECCGCESVILRHSHEFSEDPGEEISYYPPRVSRRKPTWHSELPFEFLLIFDEVYSALDIDCRRLALMGARTIVDMVLQDKVGDIGGFARKLEEMEKKGFIGRHNREFLDAALDAGNAAAHRAYAPSAEHLIQIIDIVENLLQAVYVLRKAASSLRKATPRRPRRTTAGSVGET